MPIEVRATPQAEPKPEPELEIFNVGVLIRELQKYNRNLPVELEGCDCTNYATGVKLYGDSFLITI